MRNHHLNQSGFTLIELMISMVIALFVSAGMFNLYTNYLNSTQRQDQVLLMQQNARVAMDDLERDLRLAGVDITRDDGVLPDQAVFAYAAPYEVLFNANLDNTLAGIDPTQVPDKVPANLVAGRSAFYDPSATYPLAETIRWTLDSDSDGDIDADDRMGVDNTGVYKLIRQVYGSNGVSNGPHTSVSAEGVRGPDPYPDGSRPPVLFQYWVNELDLNDDSILDANEDINGNGILDMFLWGDDGGALGVNHATASNGRLDPAEITALMTGNNGKPKVMDSFDALITPTTGDARATATTRSQALSNIRRVTVNMITETQVADHAYVNSPHGSSYLYREQSLVSTVTPRNALTKVSSDLSLTVAATPQQVQCPATSTTIQVRLVDATDALVTQPVDIVVTTSMGWFSPSNLQSATVSTSTGVATFSLVGDPNSSVTVAVVNATTTVNNKIYNAAATVEFVPTVPSSVALTPDVTALPADGLTSTNITAALLDSCGKPAGDGTDVTWAVSTVPSGIGGVMSPATTTIGGSSTISTLTAGGTAGIATISATHVNTGITGLTQVNFTDCNLVMASALPAIPADGTSNTTISFTLTDLGGVPQAGIPVNIVSDAGTIGTQTIVTDANGQGSTTLTSATTPHVASVTGSVAPTGGLCDYAAGLVKVEFADCGVTFVSSTPEVVPGNPGGTATLTATVTDSATGSPLTGQPLTFIHSGSDGSISTTSAITDGAGQGTTIYTAGPTAGVANLSVSTGCGVGNLDLFVRNCVVSVAASPVSIPPAYGNSSLITATLTDSISGAPLSNRTVTFAVDNPALGTLSSVTATTNALGDAQVTFNSNGVAGVAQITATAPCGSSAVNVVLNDWQISLVTSDPSVPQGNGATLTATLTSGGLPTNPPPGQDVVTLSFDAPGALGSTLAPLSATAIGGITTHGFLAGNTSGTVAVRADATVNGVTISDIVHILITDPPGGDPLVLDIGSEHTCVDKKGKPKPKRFSFAVNNVGLNDVEITSIQFAWPNGAQLDRIKYKGDVATCKGGTDFWRSKGCGSPDGKQNSPATLTGFCQTPTVNAGNTLSFHEVRFKDDMRGQPINVIITTVPVGGGTPATSTISFTVPN